jgi:DNA polymerase-1
MHGIPALWADEYEADDVAATATRKARAAGYRVWICSADKDLEGLVEESDNYGILVGLWNNSESTIMGPEDVLERRKVTPAQIADLLAITGDSGDNVPGVRGLGGEKAAAILRAYGNLESALGAQQDDVDHLTAEINAAAKALKKAPAIDQPVIRAQRESLKDARSLARDHRVLLDSAEVARFSRQLTGLDFDAPVDVPWDQIPIGGYDVEALRARYKSLGFEQKFSQVTTFRKRAPWAIGYNG